MVWHQRFNRETPHRPALTEDVVLIAGESDEVHAGGALRGKGHWLQRVAMVREQHHLVHLRTVTTQALTLGTWSRSYRLMLGLVNALIYNLKVQVKCSIPYTTKINMQRKK